MPSKSLRILSTLASVALAACSKDTNGQASSTESTAGNPGGTGGSALSGSGGLLPPVGGSGGSGGGTTAPATDTGAMGTTGPVTNTGGMGGVSGDDLLFVPEDLPIDKLEGGGNGINLTAFTLLRGSPAPELYVAVRNDGETSACDASITIEFFDQAEQSMEAWIGALYGGRLYQRSDDPSTIISCLDPGGVAMAGTTGLSETVIVEELGRAVYRFSYFAGDILPFDLNPVDAVTVSEARALTTAIGSVFTGTLTNGLGIPIDNPGVTVFPLNRVGRPLGMATSSATVELAPGEAWTFDTTPVNDPGVDLAAYPNFHPVVTQ